jgi:hypothetical protein
VVTMAESITLTPEELVNLTGYKQATKQLAELHRQGFWRARRCRVTGAAILERPHYDAVSRGGDTKPPAAPQLRMPTLRMA